MNRLLFLIIACVWLVACQSTQETVKRPHEHLHDHAFPDHTIFTVETEQEIFALNDNAKAFVRSHVNYVEDPIDRMETLVRKIFDRSDFNLLYMANANTVAADTFENRAANCLSMSILTYALAKEAGFTVRFQEIEIPEYWTRRDGFSLLNGHINLQIFPRDEPHILHLFNGGLEVDFDPQPVRNNFPKRYVSRDTVMAMFYNNKGADALLTGSYSKAYAYFRAAIMKDPQFDSAWTNLGFLYRLNDYHEYAENSYHQALKIDDDNLTALENLAFLYNKTGREQQAEDILMRVNIARDDNPFYHFILGEQAFDLARWDEALKHYRNALRLDKARHEIYFGLAKTYYQLGDVNKSIRYFKRAKSRSRNYQDQERYQGKLDLLSKL